ncbi:MAG: cytochrome c-type biogenesis protein CcmH [Rhodospirillales bacterium]|nr:cytochrome c-type biogenesis protein CcmH [Rhodospirillales bacterium]
MKLILAALLLLVTVGPVGAVEPDEILANPVLEKRAREISKNLRCVVCQNQSIDDSNSELAGDMRVLVRERLVRGDADSEVIAYMVSRYGDYVLLKPPFKLATYALWFGPALIFILALLAVFLYYRRAGAGVGAGTVKAPPPLSFDEKRRLDELMKDTSK